MSSFAGGPGRRSSKHRQSGKSRARGSPLELRAGRSYLRPDFRATQEGTHEKSQPRSGDQCSVDRGAECRGTCLGAAAPSDRRPDCQDLWLRLVGSGRCDPLHIRPQCGQVEAQPLVGLGAEEGQITRTTADKAGKPVKVTTMRPSFEPERVREGVGRSWLFNDQHWPLFPFHLIWDTAAPSRGCRDALLPLGKARPGRSW